MADKKRTYRFNVDCFAEFNCFGGFYRNNGLRSFKISITDHQ